MSFKKKSDRIVKQRVVCSSRSASARVLEVVASSVSSIPKAKFKLFSGEFRSTCAKRELLITHLLNYAFCFMGPKEQPGWSLPRASRSAESASKRAPAQVMTLFIKLAGSIH